MLVREISDKKNLSSAVKKSKEKEGKFTNS